LAAKLIQEQIQDNERHAKELDIEFANRLRVIGFGDGTAENPGFYGMLGESALQSREATAAAVEQARKELFEQATNPRVQEMFGLSAAVRIGSEQTKMAQHVGQQRIAATMAVSEARIATAVSDGAVHWNDSAMMDRSLAIVAGEVQEQAELAGMAGNAEWMTAKLQEAQSAVLVAAVEQAISVDAVAAQALYESRKDLIAGPIRTDLEKKLFDANIYSLVQGIAEEAAGMFPNNPVAQREYVRTHYSGRIEYEGLQELARQLSETRGDDAAYRAAVSFSQGQEDRAAETAFLLTTTGADNRVDAIILQKTEDYLFNQENRAAVRDERKLEADQAEAYTFIQQGGTVAEFSETNPTAHRNLVDNGLIPDLERREAHFASGRDYAISDDPQALINFRLRSTADQANTDPNTLQHLLTEATFKTVLQDIEAARVKQDATGAVLASFNAGKTAIEDNTPDLMWNKADATREQLAIQAEVVSEMDRYIAFNPNASLGDIRAEAMNITTRVNGQRSVSWWRGGTIEKYMPELSSAERAVVTVPVEEIRPQLRSGIANAIEANIANGNLPPAARGDQDLIEQLAGAYLARDIERQNILLGITPAGN